MELLSNDKNDKIDPQQLVPKEVRDLPSHPPLDLTPHMDKHMNKAYTCGRDVTVDLQRT